MLTNMNMSSRSSVGENVKLNKDGTPRKIPVRKPMKQETKDRISQSLSGRKMEKPRASFSHSQETKDKISLSVKASIPTRKKKVIKHRKRFSNKTREKFSEIAKLRWQSMTIAEKEDLVLKIKEGNNWSDTKPELKFKTLLEEKNIQFEQQKRILGYIVDFYIPSVNTIVEIHGCYWHGCEQCGYDKDWHIQKRREDAIREENLRNNGYIVNIVWEHQLA